MERLEYALAKARQARHKRLRGGRATTAPVAAPAGDPKADWSGLSEIKIPLRHAALNRLGATMGGTYAAPYDMLRVRVLRQMKQAGLRRLVITSPNKSCGKTTISANLALSIARQPSLRVILMDFDLRRPALAHLLGGQSQAGNLADMLRGRSDFADHALRYGENLAFCPNRAPVPHSAELLHHPDTGALLDRIEAEWKPDLIIFDMPPMLGNDDTIGFLPHADSALLVGAAGSTTLGQIDSCERELNNLTTIVGTVLNKCRYLDDTEGYGYGQY